MGYGLQLLVIELRAHQHRCVEEVGGIVGAADGGALEDLAHPLDRYPACPAQ